MGSLTSGDNFHAEREKVIFELVKGKGFAAQLQLLLRRPAGDHGPVSAEELAHLVLRSFTDTLTVLSSCAESAESGKLVSAVDCGGSASSGESKKKKTTGVKDRRGCYKRRRSLDSWVTETSTIIDGCAWRKYGQKTILNTEYPRCYYRCTHRSDGCKAIKQVQRIKEDPILYQTTYFNHHTCTETLNPSHLMIVGSDPVEPNLISFQSEIPSSKLPVKQEAKEDNRSKDLCEAKSTVQDPWKEYMLNGLDLLGNNTEWTPIMSTYQEEVGSCFNSCETTSLHGLDMEVNQLADIDNFHYFDDHHVMY